jgi:hypothetical protein
MAEQVSSFFSYEHVDPCGQHDMEYLYAFSLCIRSFCTGHLLKVKMLRQFFLLSFFFLLPVHVFSCIFPDGIDLISFLHKETSSMEHTCTQFMVNSSLYREPLVLIPLNVPFMIWISCTSSLACS